MNCANCLVATQVSANYAFVRRTTGRCASSRYLNPIFFEPQISKRLIQFEDVRHATNALHELQGNTLNGLVKGGGIRLSYSKNPLGVRTPTSATTNGMLQQQQALKDLGSVQINTPYYPSESSMTRQPELNGRPLGRRESLQSYPYTHPPAPASPALQVTTPRRFLKSPPILRTRDPFNHSLGWTHSRPSASRLHPPTSRYPSPWDLMIVSLTR